MAPGVISEDAELGGQAFQKGEIAAGAEAVGMAPQKGRRIRRARVQFIGREGDAVFNGHVEARGRFGRDRGERRRHLFADVVHQFVEEDMAPVELFQGDVLVRFMGFVDTAGAADDGRNADLLLEEAGLGAERDLGVIVAPGERFGESDDLLARVEIEPVDGTQLFEDDAAGGIDGLHLGFQLFAGIALELVEEVGGLLRADAAELEFEAAVFGHDVQRRAALDGAGMNGGMVDVIEIVERAFLLDAPCHVFQIGDHFGGVLDRVDAGRRQARMSFETAYPAAVAELALVADDDLHAGRLADDTHHGGGMNVGEFLDQAAHAEAAHFFVMTEGEVNRDIEAALEEFRRVGEADADEALHVASAAGIELAVFLRDGEWVGVPVLAVDGNCVRVPGKHDTGFIRWAERGVEIGLGAGLVFHQQGVDAETFQVVPDVVDQLHIGVAAGGVEANELSDEVDAAAICRAHGGPPFGVSQAPENNRGLGRWPAAMAAVRRRRGGLPRGPCRERGNPRGIP